MFISAGDSLVAVELREIPAYDVEAAWILEKSGQVAEDDSLLGKVYHVADV